MLTPQHLEDLRRSGLDDSTIKAAGLYSGDANEVKEILGFNAGPALVFPYPHNGFRRVKPDAPFEDGNGRVCKCTPGTFSLGASRSHMEGRSCMHSIQRARESLA